MGHMMGDEVPYPPMEPTPPGVPPVPGPSGPVPNPAITVIALGFASVLIFHIVWDATHADYSGERITFFLGVLVFAMLGYDVGKLYRRNGNGNGPGDA